VTLDRSRQIGQALMVLSGLQVLLFLIGASRRSYAALAIPVFAGLAVVSALAFWVGYTMATTDWGEPADYGVEEDEVPEAEGAPPPETIG
jgi:hypothetical protein